MTHEKHGENTHFQLTQLNRYLRASNEVHPASICCHTRRNMTWRTAMSTAISTPKYSTPIVSDDVYVFKVKCKFNMAIQPPALTYTITYIVVICSNNNNNSNSNQNGNNDNTNTNESDYMIMIIAIQTITI